MKQDKRIDDAYCRLTKYLLFILLLGAIAIFIGPPHSISIKFCMGMVVACIILGHRLPNAFKDAISLYCKMWFGDTFDDKDD